MTHSIDPEPIIAAFGNLTKAADALGVAVSTVAHWRKVRDIPKWRRQAVIDAANRAGVPLSDQLLSDLVA